MTPLLIGLTGGVAAGKSEALAAFERLGAATISADAVVHELYGSDEVRELLVERWGEQVAPDGAVDRARVGELVFERPDELAWLESQLHPRVGAQLDAWRRGLGPAVEVGVIEIPLLFEAGMDKAFDATVVIAADDEARRRRAEARGEGKFEQRSERQLSQDEKASRADHVVRNDGSIEDLERELSDLLAKLARGVES